MKRYKVKMTDGSIAVIYADDAEQAKQSAEIEWKNDPNKAKQVKAVSARLMKGCGK